MLISEIEKKTLTYFNLNLIEHKNRTVKLTEQSLGGVE